MPTPDGGWFGPRGVAVAPDGTIAVTDTGHKRIVLMSVIDGEPRVSLIGSEGSAPGQLIEPVGVTWIDNNRILVAETGNRRLQVLDREGRSLEIVELPEAWSDFYSRPQIAVDRNGRWVATDIPAQCLWVIDDGEVQRVDLTESGIVPSGLADDGTSVFISDFNSRVWVFGGSDTGDDREGQRPAE
jgi:DNA-binding beta-propeller fold protein YncE